MQFKTKPAVVEAERFTRNFRNPLPFHGHGVCYFATDRWYVSTLSGRLPIEEGDWVVRTPRGDFYLVKAHDFTNMYESCEAGVCQ